MRPRRADLDYYRDREAMWIFAVVNLRCENATRDVWIASVWRSSHGEDLRGEPDDGRGAAGCWPANVRTAIGRARPSSRG